MRHLVLPVLSCVLPQGMAQIVNPGFESGMASWQSTCPSESYLSTDVPPYGGSSSIAITMLSTTQPDCYHGGDMIQPYLYQVLSGLQNGAQVQGHLWSKAVPDLPANAIHMQGEVMVGWITSPTTFSFAFGGMAGGGGQLDWTTTTFSGTLTGMPAGATPAIFLGGHAFNNSNGTMLFDNVHISIAGTGAALNAKAWLDGAYVQNQNLMRDDLRVAGLIPTTEPYSALYNDTGGGETVAPSVLAVTGNNAIVDWVRIELRFGPPYYNNNDHVTKRHALIQRDGDIVDVDGVSPVIFNVARGNYHVVVQHRNHLPVMTADQVTLTSTATVVDLRSPATICYTRSAPGTDLPRRTVGSTRTLWPGESQPFWEGVKYSGGNNDRDAILNAIGGVVPTNTLAGYHLADVNMDGIVKYSGAGNDRDIVLQTIGGIIPTTIRWRQVPLW